MSDVRTNVNQLNHGEQIVRKQEAVQLAKNLGQYKIYSISIV